MSPVIPRQRVIPMGAWIAAAAALLLAVFCVFSTWRFGREFQFFFGPVLLVLAAYVVLVGYVYGDARRRGMRYVLWTLLAIFAPSGIGILLYFILREPMLTVCSQCGSPVRSSHAFCASCGARSRSTCEACHRVVEAGWPHCAYCGAKLK